MPSPRPTPSPADARDLRILFWCYVGMAVMTFAVGAWIYFQLDDLMLQAEERLLSLQLVDPDIWADMREDPELDPLKLTKWIMQMLVITMTPVHALVYVIAAWYLHRLKGYWTLIAIAIFNTIAAPIGTIVSVYHLVVFFRPSVKALFGK